MIRTRKSSVRGGAVSGNLLGKRPSKPKSPFSPSSSSGTLGSGNKKAKRGHGSTDRKAILQEDVPTEVEAGGGQFLWEGWILCDRRRHIVSVG